MRKFSLYYSMACAAYFTKELIMLVWIDINGGKVPWKMFAAYIAISILWNLMVWFEIRRVRKQEKEKID